VQHDVFVTQQKEIKKYIFLINYNIFSYLFWTLFPWFVHCNRRSSPIFRLFWLWSVCAWHRECGWGKCERSEVKLCLMFPRCFEVHRWEASTPVHQLVLHRHTIDTLSEPARPRTGMFIANRCKSRCKWLHWECSSHPCEWNPGSCDRMPCLRTIPDTDKREQTAGGCKSECVMRHVKVTAAHWACVCVCVKVLLNSQITCYAITLIMLEICIELFPSVRLLCEDLISLYHWPLKKLLVDLWPEGLLL